MKLVAVPIAQVELAWVSALPLVRKIVASAPDLELPRLWALVRSGQAEMWLAGDVGMEHQALGISELITWGDRTAARILGVASTDGKAWRSIIPEFKEALKTRGADIIVMEGRKGWARVFPGAAVVRYTYEVPL